MFAVACIYCFYTLKNFKTMTQESKKHTMDCTYLFFSLGRVTVSPHEIVPIIQHQGDN